MELKPKLPDPTPAFDLRKFVDTGRALADMLPPKGDQLWSQPL